MTPPARKTRWSGLYIDPATSHPLGSFRIYNDASEIILTRNQALHLACEIVVALQKNTAAWDQPLPGEIKAVVDHYMTEWALEHPKKKKYEKQIPKGYR